MTDTVIEEIKKEIDNLATKTVSNQELDTVKNYLAGSVCRAYEANLNFPNKLMNLTAFNENLDEVIETQEFIQVITPQDIKDYVCGFYPLERLLCCVATGKN